MLRMIVRRSASRTVQYYLGSAAKAELPRGVEVLGEWGGDGGKMLGLEGVVFKEHFASICENHHPFTGKQLTPRMKDNRRVGWDVNFNPPKSVSVMYALGKDERILTEFKNAIHETMTHMQREAMVRVRKQGIDEDRPSGNLLWTTFIHHLSRPVDGKPDPHLHAHVFVPNLSYDHAEKTWKALQFGEIHENAPFYQALFQGNFARRLEALGYKVERTKTAFELADVPQSVVETFSRRASEIKAEAELKGIEHPSGKAALGATTRKPKLLEVDMDEVHEEWMSRLSPTELETIQSTRERVRSDPKLSPTVTPNPERIHDPALVPKAIAYAMEKCFERQSVVDERHFLAAALHYTLGGCDPAKLKEAIGQQTELLKFQHLSRTVLTTPDIIKEEQDIVDWVKSGMGSKSKMRSRIEESTRKTLSAEQARAVDHILNSSDRVIALVGKAGTGKTTLMKTTIPAIESSGAKVAIVAPTAQTGRGTLRDEGFQQSQTLEYLLTNTHLQEQTRNGFIWVDEAGLMSMHDMTRLFKVAEKINARVTLAGDPGQHRSVLRGDAFRTLLEHADLKPAILTEVFRQSGTYKQAVEQTAQGNLPDAFETLRYMGAFKEIETEDRYEYLAHEYLEAVESGKKALIVCPTHGEGRKATELVRQELINTGKIKDVRLLPCLQKVDIHKADKRLHRAYQRGWVLEVHQSTQDRMYKKGSRLQITSANVSEVVVRDNELREQPFDVRKYSGKFHIYEPARIAIGIGERIRITQNGVDMSGRPIHNGDLYVVEGFTPNGDLILENGSVLSKDFAHIAHGYCTTSYAAQSKTVDCVIVAESSESFSAASREQFYVSITRGRKHVRIYTDCIDDLFEAVRKSSQRQSALDLLKAHEEREPIQLDRDTTWMKDAQRDDHSTPEPKPSIPSKHLLGQMPYVPRGMSVNIASSQIAGNEVELDLE